MKRFNIIYILLFLLCFNKTQAQIGAIILYENDKNGGLITLHQNWNISGQHKIWDNKISSIYIPKGFEIRVFEKIDYKGNSLILNSSISFSDTLKEWDNKISSIEILKRPKGYTLFFTSFFLKSGKWERMDDFILSSEGVLYYGTKIINSPTIDNNFISWKKENRNLFDAELTMEEKTLNGIIIHPIYGKTKVIGRLFETVYNTIPPFVSNREKEKSKIIEIPSQKNIKIKEEKETIVKEIYIPVNLKHQKYGVKIYKTANYKGESKLLNSNWNPTDFTDRIKWDGKINSIKVPDGWSIRVYYFNDFRGDYLELSDDWTIKDNPDWKGDISSIKIIKSQKINSENYNKYNLKNIKIYKTEDFRGESKLVSKDWSPADYSEKYKWSGKIKSIRVPNGWSIRVYYFEGFRGSYLELSDDWTIKDNPDWKGKISSIKIIQKP